MACDRPLGKLSVHGLPAMPTKKMSTQVQMEYIPAHGVMDAEASQLRFRREAGRLFSAFTTSLIVMSHCASISCCLLANQRAYAAVRCSSDLDADCMLEATRFCQPFLGNRSSICKSALAGMPAADTGKYHCPTTLSLTAFHHPMLVQLAHRTSVNGSRHCPPHTLQTVRTIWHAISITMCRHTQHCFSSKICHQAARCNPDPGN